MSVYLHKSEKCFEKKSEKKNVKRVSYSNTVKIAFIPCLDEYINDGVDFSQLWYSMKEEDAAKYEAVLEVKYLLETNPYLTKNLAMTYLYQPNVENIFLDIHKFKKFKIIR